MDGPARRAFLKRFLPGIVLLLVAYLFLTGYRDFRDNFQVEILDALGYTYDQNKTLISQTETLVTLGVLAAIASLSLVHDARRGLLATFTLMMGGLVVLGLGTLSLQMHRTDGYWWMVLTGLGSYLAYVPFGAVLFDRLIASTRVVGTAVFGLYLADSVGYTGSVGIQPDQYIVAAGSYSSTLMRALGVHLPVRPAKGYSVTFDGPRNTSVLSIPIVDDDMHAAIVPVGGATRVAGTVEFAGFDLTLRPERIRNLTNLAQKMRLGNIKGIARSSRWALRAAHYGNSSAI
jgi:hypothetical protein